MDAVVQFRLHQQRVDQTTTIDDFRNVVVAVNADKLVMLKIIIPSVACELCAWSPLQFTS